MTRFASCFLLIFGQLSFGGLLALAVPPFFKIERGFYKSSAAVYLSAAILTATGSALLASRSSQMGTPGPSLLWIEAVVWLAYCAACAIYLLSLWGDNGYLRARIYTIALGLGLVGVLFSTWAIEPPAFGVVAKIAYGFSAVFSSLVLGLASAGMLLGHWYLIDPNLPVDYLRSLVRLFGYALIGEVLSIVLVIAIFIVGEQQMRTAAAALFRSNHTLLLVRILIGPGASLALAWMTWQTLKIPQTMAATGLLYIAVMTAIVGELLGRFILFRTALPL